MTIVGAGVLQVRKLRDICFSVPRADVPLQLRPCPCDDGLLRHCTRLPGHFAPVREQDHRGDRAYAVTHGDALLGFRIELAQAHIGFKVAPPRQKQAPSGGRVHTRTPKNPPVGARRCDRHVHRNWRQSATPARLRRVAACTARICHQPSVYQVGRGWRRCNVGKG